MTNKVLTLKQAAGYLNMSYMGLRYYITGKNKKKKRGPKVFQEKPLLFMIEDLDVWERTDNRKNNAKNLPKIKRKYED